MTELISRQTILYGTAGASLIGLVCFVGWMRQRNSPAVGTILLLVMLAWPLWMLFEVLDNWLDTVTFRGMLAPYIVFGLVGFLVGRGVVWLTRRKKVDL
ncbi:MAG: hypothetical protein M3Y56_03960 [Armatimonadota bacterium]|nr:hypothetical protein [Armatimonadota bacterium]